MLTSYLQNLKTTQFLNEKLSQFDPSIFVSIAYGYGIIRIRSNDQGAPIPACWNTMSDLDHFLMDLLDADIIDIKTHLHCNQYDPEGNEYFTFTINFEYDH